MAEPVAVIEPTFRDRQHAPVNAGILEALLGRPDGAGVVFYATGQHTDAVREIIAVSAPQWQDGFQVAAIMVDPAGGIRFGRAISQFRMLLRAARTPARHVFMLSSGAETFFASRLAVLVLPRLRIFIVLHGNLTQAAERRSRDPRRRFFDYRSGLQVARHRRIRLLVLEPSIQQHMAASGIPGARETHVLPHPVAASEFACRKEAASARLTIGFVGHAKRSKGFVTFLALAQEGASLHDFVLAGYLAEEFSPEEIAGLNAPALPLSRAEFLRRMARLDYACLPYRPATYALTASGSLLDAAAALTPIIAFASPLMRDVFHRYGPIGFLCEDLAQMQALLITADGTASLRDQARYRQFQSHLQQLREDRLPAALTPTLDALLDAG